MFRSRPPARSPRPRSGSHAPLDAFAAPARGWADLWRTLAGLVLIVVLTATGYRLFGQYLDLRYGPLIAGAIAWAMVNGSTPGGMLLLLYSFLLPATAVLAVTRGLHGRPAGTLFGQSPRRVAGDALRVAVPMLALAVATLPFGLADPAVVAHLSPWTTLAYLPAALPAILVQTGSEELLFRGYLLQQLAARFRSPVGWMLLPSALFAAGHYAPETYGADAPFVAAWAGLFGLAAADLTARTGGIGAAIGLHFATNAAAFLLVGLAGSLDGLAVWVRPHGPDAGLSGLLAVDLMAMFVGWLMARVVLRV